MKKATCGVLAALALTLAAAEIGQAQCRGCRVRERDRHERVHHHRGYTGLPLSVEVRLDAGIPTGDADDFLDNGLGWGVTGAVDLTPIFALYGGYSNFQFEIEDDVGDDDFEDDGFDLGGRVRLGSGWTWAPFAQFGAIFRDDDTGFEAGLGADYALGNGLSLTPLARYRSIDDLD
ncbi:MAG TPA: hypothetical protein VFQ39_17915 [Longimicrobium sp.]|nr:hypothetical protein [Longimicrobium sp.]